MYILRVEAQDGTKRYAYGNEATALRRMRYWAKQSSVNSVTILTAEQCLQAAEEKRTCARP